METIIDEISQAIHRHALDPDDFRLVPASEALSRTIENHFVASQNRQWWWEDFRLSGTSVAFQGGGGWRRLAQIAPNPDELVWFIAEEDSLPYYPVFETSPALASLVIGECYAFECYMVTKDLTWLDCETHHDVLHAIGEGGGSQPEKSGVRSGPASMPRLACPGTTACESSFSKHPINCLINPTSAPCAPARPAARRIAHQ